MRNHLTVLALTAAVLGGCSTQRMQLAKSDPPNNAPKPEERVRYGLPWSKQKDPPVASKQMPPELAEQLAKSKSAPAKSGSQKEALLRAAEAEARGDLDASRAAYLQVVESDPNNATAHHRLGVIADMRQDSQTADRHYAQAYAANRRDADLLCDMGYSLFLRNRFDDSERRLKEALEVNPYHRASLSNLGLLYGKQGKYDQALAMFRQAGTESEAQRNIAQLFPNGRPGDSKSSAVAAVELRPDPPLSPRPAAVPAAAPPMPNDIDQRLAGLTLEPMRTPSPQPAAQTLSQIPGLQPSIEPGPSSAVAAKPQGSGQPWTGTLEHPVTPADFSAQPPPMNPPQYAMNGNPAPSAPWNTNPAAAPPWSPGHEVQPAGYSAPPAGWGGPVPTGPPADPSRWAAEFALGAGPGSLIPLAATAPNGLANSAAPAWGSAPAAASLAPPEWGGMATPASPAPPPSAPHSFAPASPWASSASPAGASSHWGAPSVPPASAPPANSFDGAAPRTAAPAWPAANAPSAWPSANASAPPASQPAATAGWPVIQPAGGTSAVNPSPGGQPPATTVRDWPYTTTRPQ
jgi:hypothetical protein